MKKYIPSFISNWIIVFREFPEEIVPYLKVTCLRLVTCIGAIPLLLIVLPFFALNILFESLAKLSDKIGDVIAPLTRRCFKLMGLEWTWREADKRYEDIAQRSRKKKGY